MVNKEKDIDKEYISYEEGNGITMQGDSEDRTAQLPNVILASIDQCDRRISEARQKALKQVDPVSLGNVESNR